MFGCVQSWTWHNFDCSRGCSTRGHTPSMMTTFMQDPACTRLLHQTINTSTLISFVRHSHPIMMTTFMQDPACTRLLHQTINTSTLISFVRHSHPIIACIPNSSLSCSTCTIYSPTCIHHIQISLCEFLHCHLALLVTYCYSHISCAGSLRILFTILSFDCYS